MGFLVKCLGVALGLTSSYAFAQEKNMAQNIVQQWRESFYENFSFKEITQKMPNQKKDFLKLVQKTFASACYEQRLENSFDFSSCVQVAKSSFDHLYVESIRDARQMRYVLALWLYQAGTDDWVDIAQVVKNLEPLLQDESYEFYMVKGLESAFAPSYGIYGKDTPVLVHKKTQEMSLLAFSLRD